MLIHVYDKVFVERMVMFQETIPGLSVQDLSLDDSHLLDLLEPYEDEDEDEEEEDVQPRSTSTSNESVADTVAAAASTQDNTEAVREKLHNTLLKKLPGRGKRGKATPDHSVQSSEESGLSASCSSEDIRRKKTSGVQQQGTSSGELTLSTQSHRFALSFSEDAHPIQSMLEEEIAKPKLEMLPSMTALSEPSSYTSSGSLSSENLLGPFTGSDPNLKLLQEAEDMVAGLKSFKNQRRGLQVGSSTSIGGASAGAGAEAGRGERGGAVAKALNRTVSAPASSDETIPKRLEADEQDIPAPTIIRQIKVFHPTSVTMVYHRCTWPVDHAEMSIQQLGDTIERGQEAVELNTRASRSPRSRLLTYKAPKFRSNIASCLQNSFECLNSVITENSPMIKLQSLTQCLRSLSNQISIIQQESGRTGRGASTDDLIDLLGLLLCNYDPILMNRLYPQITLLSDIIAPFFEAGPYSFSLVQFIVAFQFLENKIAMKQSIADNAEARRQLQSIS